MIDRVKSPLIKDAIEFDLKLKPYEKYVLNNGVEVYAVNAGAQEVLQIEMFFLQVINTNLKKELRLQPITCCATEPATKPRFK